MSKEEIVRLVEDYLKTATNASVLLSDIVDDSNVVLTRKDKIEMSGYHMDNSDTYGIVFTLTKTIIDTKEPKQQTMYVKEKRGSTAKSESKDIYGNKCVINNKHSFESKSGETYVELHHIIPISLSSSYGFMLDTGENIIPLCANCHRAIHHAKAPETLISIMYGTAHKFFERNKVKYSDILNLYK